MGIGYIIRKFGTRYMPSWVLPQGNQIPKKKSEWEAVQNTAQPLTLLFLGISQPIIYTKTE